MPSKKHDVMVAIDTILKTIPWQKSVNWKKIRTSMDGVMQTDIPLIQFYQNGTSYTHEQGRLVATTQVVIECVLRSSTNALYDQGLLMDYVQDILEAIGKNPNLGVPGVIHARVLSDDQDLHLLDPYFYASINLEVIYHTRFNSLCL